MFRAMITGLCFSIAGCGFVDPPVRGSGKVTSKTVETGNFTAVELSISSALEIHKGDVTSVQFSIDDNLLPLITTKVEDNVLKIYSDKILSLSDSAKINITVPSVNSDQTKFDET